ncbi:TPA_asm: alanine--tRNA ligase [Salmonella enterica subsp. salamae serovar 60:g,m,t:z6]|uniref:Alanine--tRNA ligase n=1 Tax=Salmonella enterica subsp. houtenae serovar 1,40:z4,z32:- TaxID=1967604 RepID=A0A730WMD7_SALHO|nr:alanine--tRNA ligase [Salmonella enterica]HAC6699558.1 alanine--tRNA ligase [Salmonella bongori serovar 66:z65:-]HAE2268331.1 alanine--tRNA ligase [Salmonella enterica subsp. enterica serovar 1,9,12:-:-]HAE4189811.1 alanine--tRNA ligase [Salmonella enterica subsp. houtenae serovar 1,40:z4,z32:-]HAE7514171.1 alanine--tRNA ligase [Salmonella enterica subsp. salamae serovar 60:g,m,t:z6]HCM1944353.1 alanine--tRNA ligase [Salmonella enterica subsp. salamae serovar 30:g,m,s:e,n,x]
MSKSTAEIRQAFLDFFHSKGHQVVASSSLVPNNDPTLLFTNAGMNQFKDVFLGLDKRNYSRATTSQRCVRAGGKHNDLENVGYTARHHTFFEMLGNFSFGDYFKHDAIQFAWELLTGENWFALPKERLWVTVYETDDEAYEIWEKEVGIPRERIIRIGDNKGAPYASDNFWQMGDTGPCGPCTEIFYDHGDHIWGGPPGSPEEDGDRYIEIWNIVFMQFNRQADGTMEPLPKPSVDTGMGLERIAAVLQHVNSNYEIDLFRTLIEAVAKVTGATDLGNKSLRVIADHIRSCAFLVADGVLPSNENRGYVLRRIIRRAVRHGNMLGAKETFFYKLVGPLIEVMGSAGEELKRQQTQVEQVLKTEEEQFARTLERGLALLDEELAKLQGDTLDGETAFRLYDTYGFPVDLTADVCRERNIKVDEAGFEAAMEEQRRRAREASGFGADYNAMIRVDSASEFKGYDHLELNGKVTALFVDGKAVEAINAGQEAVVVLDQTPFYAESGGQVGDKGELKGAGFTFAVDDTQKYGQAIGHLGKLSAGALKMGDAVQADVDEARRARIRLNHSATHLMHAALRQVLGAHVAQKGSLVSDKVLRFDFSHNEAMKPSEIREVEDLVNAQIRRNLPIETHIMDLEAAKAKGAMALFGEKYDERVRVLSMGDFSTELCGGTHATRTGDIGLFRIISESGTAAGVRRIEAVTGEGAMATVHAQSDRLNDIAHLLKGDSQNLGDKVRAVLERTRQLEKELQQLKDQAAAQESANLSSKAVDLNGVKLLVSELAGIEPKMLRTMVDDLKNQLGSTVIVLATVVEGKVSLIAGVSKDVTDRVKAGELIGMVAQQVGGKGGGRPDMAQAGGTDAAALPAALASVQGWVSAKLQ